MGFVVFLIYLNNRVPHYEKADLDDVSLRMMVNSLLFACIFHRSPPFPEQVSGHHYIFSMAANGFQGKKRSTQVY